VSTVSVDTLRVGDVLIRGSRLPILTDALGGAEGVLGTEALADRRVYIDFVHDLIVIARSHGQRAPPGFLTVPFDYSHGHLLVAEVYVGSVRAKAIIDTGGQVTVANLALRDGLQHRSQEQSSVEMVEGVTADIQQGEGRSAPPVRFGPLEVRMQRMTFADMSIFQYWHLTDEPALLVGMDVLGTLDTLIIDYRRHELQLRLHAPT
jgi:hypothetical protein